MMEKMGKIEKGGNFENGKQEKMTLNILQGH